MNESVGFVGGPELMRNSLILIGLTFRTFSLMVWVSVVPLAWFVHRASLTRSPLNAAGPEVTLNVAVTLAPGATGSAKVLDVSVVPETTDFHLWGTARLRGTPAAGALVVLV